jgi:hypothetical protein
MEDGEQISELVVKAIALGALAGSHRAAARYLGEGGRGLVKYADKMTRDCASLLDQITKGVGAPR